MVSQNQVIDNLYNLYKYEANSPSINPMNWLTKYFTLGYNGKPRPFYTREFNSMNNIKNISDFKAELAHAI